MYKLVVTVEPVARTLMAVGKCTIAGIFGIIQGDFLFLILKMKYCVYALKSPR